MAWAGGGASRGNAGPRVASRVKRAGSPRPLDRQSDDVPGLTAPHRIEKRILRLERPAVDRNNLVVHHEASLLGRAAPSHTGNPGGAGRGRVLEVDAEQSLRFPPDRGHPDGAVEDRRCREEHGERHEERPWEGTHAPIFAPFDKYTQAALAQGRPLDKNTQVARVPHAFLDRLRTFF